MSNEFFNSTNYPSTRAQATSASMRAQLAAIAAGFDKLPALSGNGGKVAAINAGGTAVTVAAGLTVSGNDLAVSGALTVAGATTLGDASGDALTINPSAVTWANNPTHSGDHTFSGNVTVNGSTVLGDASGDSLTIRPSAVTWSNNPTHSGNHTFNGNLTVPNPGVASLLGNVTLGGSGRTVTFASGTDMAISGGTMNVTGSFAMTGNLTAGGDLQISGNTTLGNASSDTLTIHPSTVTWSNNPTHSANHTYSGNVTVNGSLALSSGAIVPGTYTPTLTAIANVAASTANGNVNTLRIGNCMFVAGTLDIDPTSASVVTTLGISLPVSSNLSSLTQLAGGALRSSAGGGFTILSAVITGDATNDRAQISYLNDTDVANRTWSFWFMYPII